MKKRNQKFNALRLNKVIVSQMVLGGITDTGYFCDDTYDGEKEPPPTYGQNCNNSNAACQATNVRACSPR